jgi:hypothetical protein
VKAEEEAPGAAMSQSMPLAGLMADERRTHDHLRWAGPRLVPSGVRSDATHLAAYAKEQQGTMGFDWTESLRWRPGAHLFVWRQPLNCQMPEGGFKGGIPAFGLSSPPLGDPGAPAAARSHFVGERAVLVLAEDSRVSGNRQVKREGGVGNMEPSGGKRSGVADPPLPLRVQRATARFSSLALIVRSTFLATLLYSTVRTRKRRR